MTRADGEHARPRRDRRRATAAPSPGRDRRDVAASGRRRHRRLRRLPPHRAVRRLHAGGPGRHRSAEPGQPVPAEHAADDRGDLHPVGRQVVPHDRRERATRASFPSGSPTSPATARRSPSSPSIRTWPGGSTSCSPAASSTPCSASTSCCRSAPSCSSGCSPATSTASPPRNAPWCCSPCSPGRWCCRGRTPRRRSSCAPRRACCSCNASSGCSPVSPRRSARRRGPNGIAIVAACVVAAAIAIVHEAAVAIARQRRPRAARCARLPRLPRVHTGEWGAWNRAQREAWNEGWSWGATAIRFTWRFLENPLGTASGATYLHTAIALASARLRAVLLDPGAAAVADAGVRRRDRRADDRAATRCRRDHGSCSRRSRSSSGSPRGGRSGHVRRGTVCSCCRPGASPLRRCSTARSRRSRSDNAPSA